MTKGLRHKAEFALALLVCAPLAVLPIRVARAVGAGLGLLLYALWGKRRRIAVENLRAAVSRGGISIEGDVPAVVRDNFINMGRSAAELVKLYFGLGDALVRDVAVEGLEHYESARARGKGIIIATGHCGNWELLVSVIASKLGTVYGIARRQSNPYMDRFILRTRERMGAIVVYKEGALKRLLSALKEGGMTGVVMDQAVFPEEGVLVEFLGAPAWTTRTPSALAKRTGATVLPVFLRRTKAGHVMEIHPAVEVGEDDAENTRRMTEPIENYIREHPADWLWIHRRWKRAPESMPGPGGR